MWAIVSDAKKKHFVVLHIEVYNLEEFSANKEKGSFSKSLIINISNFIWIIIIILL